MGEIPGRFNMIVSLGHHLFVYTLCFDLFLLRFIYSFCCIVQFLCLLCYVIRYICRFVLLCYCFCFVSSVCLVLFFRCCFFLNKQLVSFTLLFYVCISDITFCTAATSPFSMLLMACWSSPRLCS